MRIGKYWKSMMQHVTPVLAPRPIPWEVRLSLKGSMRVYTHEAESMQEALDICDMYDRVSGVASIWRGGELELVVDLVPKSKVGSAWADAVHAGTVKGQD